jgi:hypothetical protein
MAYLMKKLILIILIFYSFTGFSQSGKEKADNVLKEADLVATCKNLYSSKGEIQLKYNKELIQKFESILNDPNSFENYEFDSLKKDLSILRSPDNQFRIIHWHIEKSDGTYEYFGFIQSKHSEIKKASLFHKTHTETIQLYPLTDKSAEIKNPENAVTDNKKWFGMRYYKIIHNKTKSKDYYTLLGWDGNDKFSQKKIIDVLTFDNAGVPHFGADIFSFQKKYPKRIIFEYSSTCSMSLKYNSKKDSIVFGHLSPIEPQLEGQYQYYCSDMSFDGFGFKKGKWNYGSDLNAVNEKDDKDKFYGNPGDISISNDKSNNYQNVLNENSPAGDGNKVVKKEKKKRKK